MRIRLPILAAAALTGALAAPVAADASSADASQTAAVPGEVVVGYAPGASDAEKQAVASTAGTSPTGDLPDGAQVVRIEDGQSVGHKVAELRRTPGVSYAVPDFRVRAAGDPPPYFPNDPGNGGLGDWWHLQWNFYGPFGVNAPEAWAIARRDGVPGGKGVTIAVIDSGVAYRKMGRFRRAPDLPSHRWVHPYDFIHKNAYPVDQDGHGTHVTGTIVQRTNNGFGLTGLAYGAKIMPLRVLDANGNGDGSNFAKAIRYAVDHHARVINMSVEFDTSLRAADIPDVIQAIKYAHNHGVVMVAAAGNDSEDRPAYPARDPYVISVAATTADGCLADYSNDGTGLDVSAPGGGNDSDLADNAWDSAHCNPNGAAREVYQETFTHGVKHFGLVGYEGTSESAPHVSAIAALIIATRVIGAHPSPAAVLARIQSTARDIGAPGWDSRYGAGLVDAAAAIRR
ncbi:MAG: S8 family serine peptidase [Actinobacteria bacterium]|nr:S8 family serine peptidase [Actinomycetota bacterium]